MRQGLTEVDLEAGDTVRYDHVWDRWNSIGG